MQFFTDLAFASDASSFIVFVIRLFQEQSLLKKESCVLGVQMYLVILHSFIRANTVFRFPRNVTIDSPNILSALFFYFYFRSIDFFFIDRRSQDWILFTGKRKFLSVFCRIVFYLTFSQCFNNRNVHTLFFTTCFKSAIQLFKRKDKLVQSSKAVLSMFFFFIHFHWLFAFGLCRDN